MDKPTCNKHCDVKWKKAAEGGEEDDHLALANKRDKRCDP